MSDYSSDEPVWHQKEIWERTAACNISFIPSPDQVQEAISWVNDNVRNEDGTVGLKKVVNHFMAWYSRGLTYCYASCLILENFFVLL